MNLNSKFNVGDNVLYIDYVDNKLHKGIISSINISVQKETTSITYNMEGHPYCAINESKIFNNTEDAQLYFMSEV